MKSDPDATTPQHDVNSRAMWPDWLERIPGQLKDIADAIAGLPGKLRSIAEDIRAIRKSLERIERFMEALRTALNEEKDGRT